MNDPNDNFYNQNTSINHWKSLIDGLKSEDSLIQKQSISELDQHIALNINSFNALQVDTIIKEVFNFIEFNHFDEGMMLSACRCLYTLLESSYSAKSMINYIDNICNYMLFSEYFDYIEQSIKILYKLSSSIDGSRKMILIDGFIDKIVLCISFFPQLKTQIITILLNLTSNISPKDHKHVISSSLDSLKALLDTDDNELSELSCQCLLNISQKFIDEPLFLKSLFDKGFIFVMMEKLRNEDSSLSFITLTIKTLNNICSKYSKAVEFILNQNMFEIIGKFFSKVSYSKEYERFIEHYLIDFMDTLLPNMPDNMFGWLNDNIYMVKYKGKDKQNNDSMKSIYDTHQQFFTLLSTSNIIQSLIYRYVELGQHSFTIIAIILKFIFYASKETLKSTFENDLTMPRLITILLESKDYKMILTAVYMVDYLLNKVEDNFMVLFIREGIFSTIFNNIEKLEQRRSSYHNHTMNLRYYSQKNLIELILEKSESLKSKYFTKIESHQIKETVYIENIINDIKSSITLNDETQLKDVLEKFANQLKETITVYEYKKLNIVNVLYDYFTIYQNDSLLLNKVRLFYDILHQTKLSNQKYDDTAFIRLIKDIHGMVIDDFQLLKSNNTCVEEFLISNNKKKMNNNENIILNNEINNNEGMNYFDYKRRYQSVKHIHDITNSFHVKKFFNIELLSILFYILRDFSNYQHEKIYSLFCNKNFSNEILQYIETNKMNDDVKYIIDHHSYLFDYHSKLNYVKVPSLNENMFKGNLEKKQKLKFRVKRDDFMKSTLSFIKSLNSNSGKLDIEFENEIGTGIGPTLEFFTKLSHEFQRKNLSMWVDDQNNNDNEFIFCKGGLYPLPTLHKSKELSNLFFSFGIFIAKSIVDKRLLDLYLSNAFYQYIFNKHIDIESLREVFPEIINFICSLDELNQLKKTIENDPSLSDDEKKKRINDIKYKDTSFDDLCIQFVLPGYSNIELIDGGNDIFLNIDNIELYMNNVIDCLTNKCVSHQFKSFIRGFNRVLNINELKIFNHVEINTILCGESEDDQNWTKEVLMREIVCKNGFTLSSKTIQNVIEIISEFNNEERRKFLQFITGSPRLPIGGFASLNPKLSIVKKDVYPPNDHYPSVSTCFIYLKLPEYSTKDILREKLLIAMENGQSGFTLS